MRRLVLVLGLVVLGWLGRRQLRSAAHAQRYLTLLALLQIIAVMGKTSASAKSVSTENRLNTVVMPALGAVGAIGAAGNATFLAGLRQASQPSFASSTGLNFTGPGSPTLVSQLDTYLNGGVTTLMNQLIGDVDNQAAIINQIISAGNTVGIW